MEGAYFMICVATTSPDSSNGQTVNAAHEFRVCIRPVEEELKDKVQVWIRFKFVPLSLPCAGRT